MFAHERRAGTRRSVADSLPPGAIAELKGAARDALNRLEFSFPEIKRMFRAVLDGKRRVTAGTDVKLPVEGVFRQVAVAIDDSRRNLAAALEQTEGCSLRDAPRRANGG